MQFHIRIASNSNDKEESGQMRWCVLTMRELTIIFNDDTVALIAYYDYTHDVIWFILPL